VLTLPAGLFTASVLFDLLALIADRPDQARGYQQRAADLLHAGLSSSLSTLALRTVEYLRAPAGRADQTEARKFALNGALIAIYLLDLAARRKQLSKTSTDRRDKDLVPIGLSLAGLAAFAIADRLT
jgi:hypothetical protein